MARTLGPYGAEHVLIDAVSTDDRPTLAAGRSHEVGLELDGAPSYCMEVAPNGTVRKLLGARSGVVPRSVANAVASRLVALGLLGPDGDANRTWSEA